MKITKINIFGFGKWIDKTFEVSDDFHIFYGLNEAGKTTLRSFIKSILFGFGRKTDSEKYKPRFGSSFGGELYVNQNGTDYIIRRVGGLRSRSGSVIVTSNGREYDESKLSELLGPADLGLYQNIFEFDERALNQVFNLKRTDFTDQILNIGMTGSQNWLQLSNNLINDAGSVFKPSGTKPILNVEMKEHRDLQKKVNEAAKENNLFITLQESNKELNDNKNRIHQEIENRKSENQKYEQLCDNWDNYQEYLKLTKALANRRNLDVDLYDNFMQVKQSFNNAKEDLKVAQQEVNKINRNTLINNPRFAFYEENQTKFDQLHEPLKEIIDLQQNNDKLISETTQLQKEKKEILNNNSFTEETPEMSESDYQEGLKLKRNYDELQDVYINLQNQVSDIESNKTSRNIPRTRNQKNLTPTLMILLVGLIVALVGIFMGPTGHIVSLVAVAVGLIGGGVSYYFAPEKKEDLSDDNNDEPNDTKLNDELRHVNQRMQEIVRNLTDLKNKYNYDFPIDTFLNFQRDLHRLHQDTNTINTSIKKQSSIQKQILNYLNQFNFAKNWIQISLENINQSVQKINDFYNDMINLSTINAKNNEEKKFYNKKINNLNFKMDDANKEMAKLLNENGLKSEMELEVYHHDLLNREKQREKLKIYENNLSNLLPKLTNYENLEQLNWSKQQNLDKIQNLSNQEKEINHKILDNQAKLNMVIDTKQYDQLRQELANLESQIETLTKSWLTNYLGSSWIKEALDEATQERFPKIIEHATDYFNLLTNGRYKGIHFEGDSLNVERNDNQTFDISQLSQGTAEQLYVSLRFSFAISFLDKIQLPLIIDDAFINFDVIRRAKVIELIQKLKSSTQLLFFTTDLGIRNQFIASNHLTELVV